VLPDTPRCREQFQWLAAEILEMGGEALFWEAGLVSGTRDAALMRSFLDQADRAYRSILRQLAKKKYDLPALSQQFQQLQQQDYFRSEVGTRVREALLAARKGSGK
jgi:phosphate uptake regulator